MLQKKKIPPTPRKKKAPTFRKTDLDGRSTAQIKAARAGPAAIIKSAIQANVFQGPLPPPDLLREYDNIIPDGAERILTMAERQQKHDHEMDHKEANYRNKGLNAGMFMFPLSLLAGIVLVYLGAQWAAVALFAPLTLLAIMSFIGGHDNIMAISRNMGKNKPDNLPESHG